MKPLIRYGVKINDKGLLADLGQPYLFRKKAMAVAKRRVVEASHKFFYDELKVVKLEIREVE